MALIWRRLMEGEKKGTEKKRSELFRCLLDHSTDAVALHWILSSVDRPKNKNLAMQGQVRL